MICEDIGDLMPQTRAGSSWMGLDLGTKTIGVAVSDRLLSSKGRVFEFKKNMITNYDDYYRYIESFEVMEDELFLFLKESPTSDSVEEKSLPFILLKESLAEFDKKKKKKKKF